MVLPLIPIAGAAILGGVSGGLLSGLFGSKKEELIQTQEPKIDVVVEAAPYQHFQPQLTHAPQYTYGYVGATHIIESPGAEVTKKQDIVAKLDTEQVGKWETSPTVSPTQELTQKATEGTNMLHIAIIAAVGLVAYGLVSKTSIVKGSKK